MAKEASLYCGKQGKMELGMVWKFITVSISQSVVRTNEVMCEKHWHVSTQSTAATIISRTNNSFKIPEIQSLQCQYENCYFSDEVRKPPYSHFTVITYS